MNRDRRGLSHLASAVERVRHEARGVFGARDALIAAIPCFEKGDRRERHELAALRSDVQPLVDRRVAGAAEDAAVAQRTWAVLGRTGHDTMGHRQGQFHVRKLPLNAQ